MLRRLVADSYLIVANNLWEIHVDGGAGYGIIFVVENYWLWE